MATPTAIAAYVALFALTGFLFLFANLLVGWLVRPRLPNQEKLEVYECGEPTIGSSFVQFDLRFYVVALLFIIFDVEVAFFFPWAAVFGKATQLAACSARRDGRADRCCRRYAATAATRLARTGLAAMRRHQPQRRRRSCKSRPATWRSLRSPTLACFSPCCWSALRTCGSAATWIGCGPSPQKRAAAGIPRLRRRERWSRASRSCRRDARSKLRR